MLPAMMSYQDVVFLNRSDDKDARDVRRLYALHCLNHIMRSRARVRKHDAEIKGNREEKKNPIEIKDTVDLVFWFYYPFDRIVRCS